MMASMMKTNRGNRRRLPGAACRLRRWPRLRQAGRRAAAQLHGCVGSIGFSGAGARQRGQRPAAGRCRSGAVELVGTVSFAGAQRSGARQLTAQSRRRSGSGRAARLRRRWTRRSCRRARRWRAYWPVRWRRTIITTTCTPPRSACRMRPTCGAACGARQSCSPRKPSRNATRWRQPASR